MRLYAALAIVGILSLAAEPSHSALLTQSSVGESFTVNWVLANDTTDPNGNTNNTGQDITAEAVFTLDAFDMGNDSLTFTIKATNTTAVNDDEIGLFKFGFGTNPDATGVDFIDDPDGEFIDATASAFPNFPDKAIIDVTSTTGPGALNTLQAGEMDVFSIRVSFSDLVADSEVEISPFNAFFQSDPESFQVRGTEDTSVDNGDDPTPTPEPATLALIGTGLAGIGWLSRRRRTQA